MFDHFLNIMHEMVIRIEDNKLYAPLDHDFLQLQLDLDHRAHPKIQIKLNFK